MISKKGMEPDIQLLELATGIKDSLTKSGFTTINFILSSTTTDISKKSWNRSLCSPNYF
jgi:hypothetical protein